MVVNGSYFNSHIHTYHCKMLTPRKYQQSGSVRVSVAVAGATSFLEQPSAVAGGAVPRVYKPLPKYKSCSQMLVRQQAAPSRCVFSVVIPELLCKPQICLSNQKTCLLMTGEQVLRAHSKRSSAPSEQRVAPDDFTDPRAKTHRKFAQFVAFSAVCKAKMNS